VELSMLLSAVVIAIGLVLAAKKIANAQIRSAATSTIATIAGRLVAARIGDTEYMNRVTDLRHRIKHGLEFYPGNEKAEKEKQREIEFDRERLREIDYMDSDVRSDWLELARTIYEESLAGTT
jgi:hypothetical protein